MNRGTKLLRTTALASLLGYLNQVVSVVTVPMYLAALGVENYGLMVTALSLAGYFTLADGGLSWGGMILMGQAHGRRDRREFAHAFRHGLVLAGASGLVALGAGLGVFAAIAAGGKIPFVTTDPSLARLVLVISFHSASAPLSAMIYNAYFGLQEGHWPAMLQGLARLLGALGGAAIAWWQHETWLVLLVGLLSGWSCTSLAGILLWRRNPWLFARGTCLDRGQYEKQIRSGGKNFLLQLSKVVGSSAPVLVIGSVAGPAYVPLFTLSWTIIQLLIAPLNNWGAMAQTTYGEAWAGNQRVWVVSTLTQALRFGILVGGLLASVVSFCIPPAVAIISHGRLAVPYLMALGITVAGGVAVLTTLGQFALTGINRQRKAAFGELANGLLSFVFCSLAVKYFGPTGVGWALAAAALTTSFQVLPREIVHHFELEHLPVRAEFLGRVIVGVVGAATVVAWWRVDPRLELPVQTMIVCLVALGGTVTYFGLCLGTRALTWSDLRGLAQIFPKGKGR